MEQIELSTLMYNIFPKMKTLFHPNVYCMSGKYFYVYNAYCSFIGQYSPVRRVSLAIDIVVPFYKFLIAKRYEI